MPTITSLCNKGILLERGKTKYIGATSEAVMQYYTSGVASPTQNIYEGNNRPGDNYVRLNSCAIKVNNQVADAEIDIRDALTIEVSFEIIDNPKQLLFNVFVFVLTAEGTIAFITGTPETNAFYEKGTYTAAGRMEGNFLNEGTYFVNLGINSLNSGTQVHIHELNALSFNIKDPIDGVPTRNSGYSGIIPGIVRPLLNWKTEKIA
jgi:lipopolysaccharide transport system ATP-binding protein